MRKITLDLDRLAVESFPTTAEAGTPRGTVEGAMRTRELYCTNGDTCRTSCAGGGGGQLCTCPIAL